MAVFLLRSCLLAPPRIVRFIRDIEARKKGVQNLGPFDNLDESENNLLRLNLSTPSRGSGSPTQPQKLFPALLGSIAAQVFPPLEQGGLTVGHLPAVIDEHP